MVGVESLTVLCVRWGDKYDSEYVYRLESAVNRHLSVPHEFACVTASHLPGVRCVDERVPYPGWWQKIGLLSYPGPWIYFDLDVVIVGDLDWLADYTCCGLAAVQDWWAGHGGPLYDDEIQSSVMVSDGRHADAVGRFSWADIDRLSPHGDQSWLTEALRGQITYLPQERVVSYKRHARGALPDDASVVVFHGEPKPHQVDAPWIREHWEAT